MNPLYYFLEDIKDKNNISLSLKEIEEILGKKLPQKAYTEIQRWENSDSHTQARTWLRAGWKVEHPSDVVKTGKVKFVKQLDNSNNITLEKKDGEIAESNQENKATISVPCGSLVYMIAIPIIPLGLACYYYLQEKEKIALTYLKISLVGMGIGSIIYIISDIF